MRCVGSRPRAWTSWTPTARPSRTARAGGGRGAEAAASWPSDRSRATLRGVPDRLFRTDPEPSKETCTDEVLAATRPCEPMNLAGAEVRLREVQAQIAEIGRQIEDKNRRRSMRWASDPHDGWRRAATAARGELREELRDLRWFIESERAKLGRADRAVDRAAERVRQEVDRATKSARRGARKEYLVPLWDVYLQAEVALLTIAARGAPVGAMGESVLACAKACVPEWYRDYWMRAVYAPRWGSDAAPKGEGDGSKVE